MNHNGKTKIRITAAYRGGLSLYEDKVVPARTLIQDIPVTKAFREVTIRMVVATHEAEELFEGLNTGGVSLYIENMQSKVERH